MIIYFVVVGSGLLLFGLGLFVRRMIALLTYEHAEGEVIAVVGGTSESYGRPRIRFVTLENETIEFVSTASITPLTKLGSRVKVLYKREIRTKPSTTGCSRCGSRLSSSFSWALLPSLSTSSSSGEYEEKPVSDKKRHVRNGTAHAEAAGRGVGGQGSRSMRMELTAIDSWRSAFLHMPLGIILGIYTTIALSSHIRGCDWLYALPLVVGLFALAGWLAGLCQAVAFNVYVRLMRRGPVFVMREVGVHEDRSEWLAMKAAANRAEARQFVRDAGRAEETSSDEKDETDVTDASGGSDDSAEG